MRFGLRHKTLAAYIAVLALGLALSGLVYFNGRAVLDISTPLLQRELPLLEYISGLKVAMVEEEVILYEYYATADRKDFLLKHAANVGRIHQSLDAVSQVFSGDAQVRGIQSHVDRTLQLAQALDATLGVKQIDWDRAREVLAEMSTHTRVINRDLDELVRLTQRDVYDAGRLAESKISLMIVIVLGFSATILLVAIFIGYYVNAYLADAAERQRLAMFAEKNPHPVLRLAEDGRILYFNPGAEEMLRKIGVNSNMPALLLPPDLRERLDAIRADPAQYGRWEHQVGELTLGCGTHYIPGFAIFHAYLSDITEQKRAQERLTFLAYHDPLTGLPNRARFGERVAQALQTQPSGSIWMAILLIDLDRFRLVNNSLGRNAGDALLRGFAQRLDVVLSDSHPHGIHGELFRFDGDTFCILLLPPLLPERPRALAERIRVSTETPFQIEGQDVFTTLSIGISACPGDGKDASSLIKNADAAMVQVKKRGGAGYEVYGGAMSAQALDRLSLETDLRRALERGELLLHYQPQVALSSGRIIGFEALLRWRHPTRGMVSPAEFIPVAEDSGLIVQVGEWALRTACAQARAWNAEKLPVSVAVNISARQFAQPDFTRVVGSVLRDTACSPAWIELEVTESAAMRDADVTVATMQALKVMGVALAIDDFGTGFSSLSYLKRFPIDRLKVDQSFVRDLTSDPDDAAISQAVISLGHSLGLKVIAEGVETDAQLALLAGYGCDEVQGYLVSRPVPVQEATRLLMLPAPLPGMKKTAELDFLAV